MDEIIEYPAGDFPSQDYDRINEWIEDPNVATMPTGLPGAIPTSKLVH